MRGTTISVPYITRRRIPIPKEVLRLLENRFVINGKKIPIATDFDDTFFPSPSQVAKRFDLSFSIVESPYLGLLQQEIPFIFITGSKKAEIDRRLINPSRETLQRLDLLHRLQLISSYSNGGALRSTYKEDGTPNQEEFEAYQKQFKIPPEDEEVLVSILKEAGYEYWQKYLKSKKEMGKKYPLFNFREPAVEPQDKVKLTLSPLPPQEREITIRLIRQRLEEIKREDLLGRYQIRPGGRSTIDVLNAKINKGFALRDALKRFEIPESSPEVYPVVYFGDTFCVHHGESGEIYRGDDLEILEVLNVVPIAVNKDQKEIKDLPRVIPGGSGPEATLIWLTYFNQSLAI